MAVRLLQALAEHEVSLIISAEGEHLLELEAPGSELPAARRYDPSDFAAPVASSSRAPDAMVVCPCTMRTVAAIAHGFGDNLITHCAENVMRLKRPLVLVPRETPLSVQALANMHSLATAGVFIVPPMVTYYFGPRTLDDLNDFCVGKVLDCLRLEHHLYRRWGEEQA